MHGSMPHGPAYAPHQHEGAACLRQPPPGAHPTGCGFPTMPIMTASAMAGRTQTPPTAPVQHVGPPGGPSFVAGPKYSAGPIRWTRPLTSKDGFHDDDCKQSGWYGTCPWLMRAIHRGQNFATEHSKELICWGVLFGLVMSGYAFFSDGSFSAILTLSSVFQCFAFVLLLIKVRTQYTIVGVSVKSLRLYLLSLVSRLNSTLFFIGYLPVDRSGNRVYQLIELSSVALLLVLLYSARRKTRESEASRVSLKHDSCHTVVPVIVLLVFAYFVHPSLNRWDPADIAWAFALYVETIAVVPQIFLMGKSNGEVEVFTSHYIASMGISKIFGLIFWIFSYHELESREGNIAGWTVLVAYGIQAVLFADFLYYYVKNIRMGKSLIISGV